MMARRIVGTALVGLALAGVVLSDAAEPRPVACLDPARTPPRILAELGGPTAIMENAFVTAV